MKFAENKDGFDLGQVLDFCRKNIRYISAAVIVVVLVIVLAVATLMMKKDAIRQEELERAQTEEIQQDEPEQTQEEVPQVVEYQVDAIPEINTLIQNYYTAYAAGDMAALEACATPFSELEKSYIGLTNKYISSYENIQCYTKPGLNAGEYAVSVVLDMRLNEVETLSPTLRFFYVRQNEAGAYYIDNIYSDFNTENRVLEFDSQMETFIADYEGQENFIALWNDVQARYDAALAADENLKNIVENVFPAAVQEWVDELVALAEKNTSQEPVADQPEETPEEAPVADQPEETPEETPEDQPAETPEEAPSQDDSQSEGGSPQINYVPEGKVLTASQGYNVRVSMSEDAERLGTTEIGDEIKVILSYAEGWTKVEWKEKTGYIRTDLLLNN